MAQSTEKNHPKEQSAAPKSEFFYYVEPGLKAAVEVARDLRMPLLITGEPGTGKTELAEWIARWLVNPASPDKVEYKQEVFRFNTKTTSIAKDLFYRYDAIRHFGQREAKDLNPLDFVSFEAMGKAIIEAKAQEPRRVVLVDEIDKAPRDFPNDVLFQFEKFAFRVEEAVKEDFARWSKRDTLRLDDNLNIRLAEGAEPPFLLLTSNSEKNLPDAFLRRCVFFHIAFPEPSKNPEVLAEIVRRKARVSETYRKHLETHLPDILKHFESVRNRGLQKKPATAELIRWIDAMGREGREIFWDKIQWDKADDPLRARFLETMPVLLKTKEDLEIYKPGN